MGLPSKSPANKLKQIELKRRREIILKEIRRVSLLLNKPIITQSDLILNSNLKLPNHSYIRIFGGFGKALEEAGLKKPEFNFYDKRDKLKKLFKQIAVRHNNTLSIKIIMSDTNKSWNSILNTMICPYFGGIYRLCKDINCDYKTNNVSTKTFFETYKRNLKDADMVRTSFADSMVKISKDFGGSLSNDILRKNSSLSFNTLNSYAHKWFGGFKSMCKELDISWIDGDRGIDRKELDILKDIRQVYLKSDNKISQVLYKKHGKYSLELVADYFGSFGKACLEVNIKTEAMQR